MNKEPAKHGTAKKQQQRAVNMNIDYLEKESCDLVVYAHDAFELEKTFKDSTYFPYLIRLVDRLHQAAYFSIPIFQQIQNMKPANNIETNT